MKCKLVHALIFTLTFKTLFKREICHPHLDGWMSRVMKHDNKHNNSFVRRKCSQIALNVLLLPLLLKVTTLQYSWMKWRIYPSKVHIDNAWTLFLLYLGSELFQNILLFTQMGQKCLLFAPNPLSNYIKEAEIRTFLISMPKKKVTNGSLVQILK